MNLAELAQKLGATLQGDGEAEITGVAGIEEAGPGQITFLANPKYSGHARTTQAAAILVAPDFPRIEVATLRIDNPYLAFARALELFHPPRPYPPGIHPTAVIDPTATVGRRAHVGAYVVIGPGAVVGDDAILLPHAVLYPGVRAGNRLFAHAHAVVRENCTLGDDVILQNGVVVGSDGFGFAKTAEGTWHKIPQAGPVVIGNGVEIQANSCIDRASVGQTSIGDGSKVDNLVQVGHGTTVGRNTLLCAQVGLAGSTHVGNGVILAGQVGVAGHCHIGDNVVATAQSGLHGNIEPGKVLSGSPAVENRQWLRIITVYNRLPELIRQLQRRQREDPAAAVAPSDASQ